jgi:hypothetical protein
VGAIATLFPDETKHVERTRWTARPSPDNFDDCV